MIVSSALPIQFWPADEETFNEKEACGVETRCWCQPIQCDDLIYLQFTGEGSEDLFNYGMLITDSDGDIVYSQFGIGSGHSGEFLLNPQIFGICDGEYQMVIFIPGESVIILDGSLWTPVVGSFDSVSSDTFSKNLTSADDVFTIVSQPATDIAVDDIFHFTLRITITGTWTGQIVVLGRHDSGGVIGPNPSEYTFSSNVSSDDVIYEIQSGATTGNLEIFLQNNVVTGSADVSITIFPQTVVYVPQPSKLYKSDCLDIRESHECTHLITYENTKDFAGLRYQNLSPGPQFTIRVPCVFFHDSYEGEDEVHPRSNDTWRRLSSKLEKKRKLEVGYVPYYFHEKLQLILMHDYVEIDGLEWKKRDAYTIEEGNRRYPLKTATVMLTDRNFIKRNII